MERREAVGRGVVVIELVLRRFWLVRVGSVLGPGSQGRVLVISMRAVHLQPISMSDTH